MGKHSGRVQAGKDSFDPHRRFHVAPFSHMMDRMVVVENKRDGPFLRTGSNSEGFIPWCPDMHRIVVKGIDNHIGIFRRTCIPIFSFQYGPDNGFNLASGRKTI